MAGPISEQSNQDESNDFDQEREAHNGDGQEHVARRDRGHSVPHRLPTPSVNSPMLEWFGSERLAGRVEWALLG